MITKLSQKPKNVSILASVFMDEIQLIYSSYDAHPDNWKEFSQFKAFTTI